MKTTTHKVEIAEVETSYRAPFGGSKGHYMADMTNMTGGFRMHAEGQTERKAVIQINRSIRKLYGPAMKCKVVCRDGRKVN